jgi:predicted Zn-dependent protease
MHRRCLALAAAILLAGCASDRPAGRKPPTVATQQADAEAARAYQEIVRQSGIADDAERNALVQSVGARVARASDAPQLDWQFTVVRDDSANAAVLPGGRVVVNSGLFTVVHNDAQLAAVLANLAARLKVLRPSAESRDAVMKALTKVIMEPAQAPEQNAARAEAIASLLGVPTAGEEAEIDRLGLLYMARAGYDPRAAIAVWQNFAAAGGKTQPLAAARMARLQRLMPQALQMYAASQPQ